MKMKEFEDAVKVLMKYLAENHNPHTTVIVSATEAELLSGEMSVLTDEFIID